MTDDDRSPPYPPFPTATWVAFAVAAAISACGATAHPALPRSNGGSLGRTLLVRQADRICQSAALALRAIKVPTNRRGTAHADVAYIVDTSTAITERETRELQRLKAPAEVAAPWQAFITAQDAGEKIARALKLKVDVHDPGSAALLPRAAGAAAAIAAAAKNLGAASCAATRTPLAVR